MSGSTGWLDARRPAPPADLKERFGSVGKPGSDLLVDHLTREATVALDRARAARGRVRSSALDLLVADALFTYACEAALELPQAEEILEDIMTAAAKDR